MEVIRVGQTLGAQLFVVAIFGLCGQASSSTAETTHVPDFNGFWLPNISMASPKINGFYFSEPHLTPWAMDFVKMYKRREESGNVISEPSAKCMPKGFPYNMEHILPMDFVQSPGELVILVEERSTPRHIYLDERKHPSDDDLTYSTNGHSIGHWEGQTLVIDTIGIEDDTLLSLERVPHSKALHIVERMSLTPDRNTITDRITMTDPKTFTEPYIVTLTYSRAKPGAEAMEYLCIPDANRLKP